MNKYIKDDLKIGIITYHRSHNYGAFLQSFALVNYLKDKLKLNVEVIDFSMKTAKKMYIRQIFLPYITQSISGFKRYIMFNKALSLLPQSKKSLCSDNLDTFNTLVKDNYDVIITGSDEVWKLGLRGFPNPYFLPGDLGCIKLAYAVSSRSDFSKLDSVNTKEFISILNTFQYIGVRDNSTYEELSKYICNKSILHKNCDPVFLYDFKQNSENGRRLLIERFKINSSKPTITMMIGNKEYAKTLLKNLRNTYGNNYNYVAVYNNFMRTNYCPDITPFEWIDVIAASDFFITTYFHGMCFALKSNTPFFSVECRKNENTKGKSYDILSESNLLDRYSFVKDNNFMNRLIKIIDSDIGKRIDFSLICNFQKTKVSSFISELEKIKNGGCNNE